MSPKQERKILVLVRFHQKCVGASHVLYLYVYTFEVLFGNDKEELGLDRYQLMSAIAIQSSIKSDSLLRYALFATWDDHPKSANLKFCILMSKNNKF